MKNNNNIRPIGLKGNEQLIRMKKLMGAAHITENTKTSVVELTKMGPDGKIYGIVRENHKYFIKITNKKQNLVTEDFRYIGGLKNKTEKSYDSYSQATKQLNLKFLSLNEALNKTEQINVLENDNLLAESFESYSEKVKGSQPDSTLGTVKDAGKNDGHEEEIIGDAGETGNPDVDTPKTDADAKVIPKGDDGDPYVEKGAVNEDGEEITEDDEDDVPDTEKLKDELEKTNQDAKESSKVTEDDAVELNENEKAIDNIIRELNGETLNEAKKLSITTAIYKIKEGEQSSKKKV